MTRLRWTLHDGRFHVSGPAAWITAWRTLHRSLGREASDLVAAATAADPGLRALERRWAQRLLRRLDVRLHSRGLDTIDPDERYVVVALHEGFADALVLQSLGIDLRFAGRSELWSWPVLGDYLRAADHLIVDPERPVTSLRTLLRTAEQVFAAGESLALFAQGTLLGIETGLHPGAFEVAKRTKRRVLPVVIAGTHRIWEHPFSPQLRFGCPVWLEVLPPEHIADPLVAMDRVERRLKQRALGQEVAPPRHFDPDRDGVWPNHAYRIDPAFPEVARRRNELYGSLAVEEST